MPRLYSYAPRVHKTDSNGNLEWVERIIASKRYLIRRGKFHLTEDGLRKLMRQAYRNGASEHHIVIADAVQMLSKMVPDEAP